MNIFIVLSALFITAIFSVLLDSLKSKVRDNKLNHFMVGSLKGLVYALSIFILVELVGDISSAYITEMIILVCILCVIFGLKEIIGDDYY